jgi:hypothetical protein
MAEEAQKTNEVPEPDSEDISDEQPRGAAQGSESPAEKTQSRRELSSIAFAYNSMDDAEDGAKEIYSRAGTTSLTQPQAAAAMNTSHTSSAFRARLAAMKLFGLLEYDQGRIQLTELGRAIADPHSALEARVEAFLRVPLYQKYTSLHDGHILPKSQALESEFVALGVARKQAERARQVFERSARHAGFVRAGSDRFVRPITASRAASGPKDDPPQKDGRREEVTTGGGGGGGDDLDPVVRALVQKIPPPGAPWGVDEQVMWLRMMAMAFSMAYGGKTPIKIEADSP